MVGRSCARDTSREEPVSSAAARISFRVCSFEESFDDDFVGEEEAAVCKSASELEEPSDSPALTLLTPSISLVKRKEEDEGG